MLENFIKVADMPQEVIEKYKGQVPAELVQIWQEDGLGTFLAGYLKVINPDDYLELLQDSYFRGDCRFSYVRDSLWRYYYLGKEYLCGNCPI